MLQNILFTDSESVSWNEMDALFQKFYLQNLLRQFFCGVVFFVPLRLFSRDLRGQCDIGSLLDITEWKTGTFLFIAALASIIGTVIYHLETNLYSYAVQCLYEALRKHYRFSGVCFVVAFVFVISLSPLCCDIKVKTIISLTFFSVVYIVCLLFGGALQDVLVRTRSCWIIEGKELDDKSSTLSQQKRAIALKVAEWSNFIHCVQSCCFAWLLGCACCQRLFIEIEFTCCESCFFEAMQKQEELLFSVHIAFSILFLELLFDWHRYQHVIAMTTGEIFPKKSRFN